MGQIKMADYSNFLSEADKSNLQSELLHTFYIEKLCLQYEVTFCEKEKKS